MPKLPQAESSFKQLPVLDANLGPSRMLRFVAGRWVGLVRHSIARSTSYNVQAGQRYQRAGVTGVWNIAHQVERKKASLDTRCFRPCSPCNCGTRICPS